MAAFFVAISQVIVYHYIQLEIDGFVIGKMLLKNIVVIRFAGISLRLFPMDETFIQQINFAE